MANSMNFRQTDIGPKGSQEKGVSGVWEGKN